MAFITSTVKLNINIVAGIKKFFKRRGYKTFKQRLRNHLTPSPRKSLVTLAKIVGLKK